MNSTDSISQKTLFAINLSDYISASGMNQAELAKRVGIATTTLSSYVNGVRFPRAEILRRIADALGVSVGALLGENNEEIMGEHIVPSQPEINAVVRCMLQLPLDRRKLLVVIAEALRNDYDLSRYGGPGE